MYFSANKSQIIPNISQQNFSLWLSVDGVALYCLFCFNILQKNNNKINCDKNQSEKHVFDYV